ncbi:hypothetical protein ACFIJ5_13280 [Haloimpatiens sp. FM7330]
MDVKRQGAKERARQMLIDGVGHEEIMRETNLRLKDIKRIEKDISEHF